MKDGEAAANPQLGNSRNRDKVPSPHPLVVTYGEGNQRVEAKGTQKLMEGGVNQGENVFSKGARRGVWRVSESEQ